MLDITHLVICTELTNSVCGIGKNFVKFVQHAENIVNITESLPANMKMVTGIGNSHDNKVYTNNETTENSGYFSRNKKVVLKSAIFSKWNIQFNKTKQGRVYYMYGSIFDNMLFIT